MAAVSNGLLIIKYVTMVYMKRCIPFLFLSLVAPIFAFAEVSAGIPSGGLWFSKEPFFAGEQITVSTVIFNATQNDISGSLELMDKETVLERKEVSLVGGQSKVVDFNILVSEGKHVFSIRVAGGDFNLKSGSPLDLKVKNSSGGFAVETTKAVRDAMKDSDVDGIADINDSDIDGDSLPNEKEKKLGTNPNNPDTDGDGILDGVDKNPLKFDELPSSTSSISPTDTKKITDKVEKIIPTSVVTPVANVATPIIGSIENLRVDEANRNSTRISNSIDNIIDGVGVSKILGAHTSSTGTKPITGKPTGWEVAKTSISGDNFSKTPFGYIKLFVLVIYQFVLSNIWVFYILGLVVLIRMLIGLKRLIFNRGE